MTVGTDPTGQYHGLRDRFARDDGVELSEVNGTASKSGREGMPRSPRGMMWQGKAEKEPGKSSNRKRKKS